MRKAHPSNPKSQLAAYAAFFVVGLVEFRFQWHLLFDLDRSAMVQYYFESLLLISLLAIFGCWSTTRSSRSRILPASPRS